MVSGCRSLGSKGLGIWGLGQYRCCCSWGLNVQPRICFTTGMPAVIALPGPRCLAAVDARTGWGFKGSTHRVHVAI